MGAAATGRRYYPAVQGLRGFAALSVLLLHLYEMADHGGFLPTIPALLAEAWSTLGQGVPLFFIISGFVIPGSLLRHKDLGRFFVDRLLRIMPLFVVLHLLVFTIGPFVGYKWLRGIGLAKYLFLFITNLTFTAYPLHLVPLAQQNSWTLTFEWGFYLLIGAAWFAWNRTRTRAFTLPLLGLLALASCYVAPICLYFGLGMLFARYPQTIRLHPVLEVLLVPASLIAFYELAQIGYTVLAIVPAAVVYVAVLQDDSFTAKILKTRPLQYLGLISYSLYLVHPIALFPFQTLGHALVAHGVPAWKFFIPYLVAGTAVAFVASIAGYHLIEVRLRTYLARLFKADGWEKRERLVAV